MPQRLPGIQVKLIPATLVLRKGRTMHAKLAAGIGAKSKELLSPVNWRRAFEEIAERRQKREQTNSQAMAIVGLTAAVAPLFPVALHVIFRF